jgi:hypothetical protein
MTKENRTGANHVSMFFKELQKKSKPLTPAEQAAEKLAWKAQELNVDYFDRVIR